VTTTLAFGNRLTGSNTDLNLTLSNTGNAPLNGISVGAFPAGFSRNGGTCGASLNAGTTCTITVRFSPTAVATYSGTVSITASNAVTGSPVTLSGAGIAAPGTVAFTGEAGPAAFTLGGTTLSFGNLTGNVSDTVTLTVGGGTPVTFGTAAVANGVGTAFSMGADTCSNTTVSPGGTCTITVNFNGPAGFSLRIGTLNVPHNGSGNPAVLLLTGS
jgi:hypothetical protein